MRRNTKYESYTKGNIQDIRYSSDYRPTINRSLIPARKRQFNRVYHDSPPNNPSRGYSGGSSRAPVTDENRPREFIHPF